MSITATGAVILEGLEQQEWKCLDFYVEDPDGQVLCFSEQTD